MLNPFPIQYLALFAYFILRLTIAGVLFLLAYRHYRHRHLLQNPSPQVPMVFRKLYSYLMPIVFPLAEALIAGFILVGAWTQYAVLAVMIMSIKMLFFRHWLPNTLFPSRLFYLLLLGASITLFITGAGVLAFDLPL